MFGVLLLLFRPQSAPTIVKKEKKIILSPIPRSLFYFQIWKFAYNLQNRKFTSEEFHLSPESAARSYEGLQLPLFAGA